ncbi:MAG: ABC transporter substrate-binding protein [Hormoscilla sp. GM102CHS1]|nr:ABC transporter substrate-binding protein [Hormoscilla sp. GM102CHS1]
MIHLLRRYGAIAIALIIITQISIVSCTPREIPRKSQLVLATLGDPKTFNPALNQEFPNVFIFTFEGLTRENGITGEIEPALAESWEISRDRKRVVFTLRKGLKWSDGQPLTADDVVFTYKEVVFNPDIPTDAKDPLRIGERRSFPTVRKLGDPRLVEFTLPEPFAPFLRATGVSILPAHVLRKSVLSLDGEGNPQFTSTWNTGTQLSEIVVNGPYKIESYNPSERVIFTRNPYYWRQDAEGNQLPYIDRIVWQVVESTETQLLQFRSGTLDIMGDSRPLRPEYFSLLKREEKRGKFTIKIGGSSSSTTFMAFNLNQAKNERGEPFVDPVKSRWFNSKEFRQAIAHALDRQRMVNNIFRGIGVRENSPVSVQSPYFLSPEAGLKVYEYNLEKAQELLRSAGFQYDKQGLLLDAEGNQVRFTLLTNAGNKIREAIGVQVKQDLGKIGIPVDFRPIAFSTLVSKLTNTRDWEAHIIGFTGGVEPHNGANLWTSSGGSHLFNQGPQPGETSIQAWQVSDWEREIDRLFVKGARELDEQKRKKIYAEFQQLVQEQLPLIFLVNEVTMMAVRDRVTGLKYSGLPSWGLWNIYEVKIDENG